jgi:hypothetical protein
MQQGNGENTHCGTICTSSSPGFCAKSVESADKALSYIEEKKKES